MVNTDSTNKKNKIETNNTLTPSSSSSTSNIAGTIDRNVNPTYELDMGIF